MVHRWVYSAQGHNEARQVSWLPDAQTQPRKAISRFQFHRGHHE